MNKFLGSFASLAAGLLLCGALLAYGVTEEVPVGGVEGLVAMKENGKPLAKAMVILRSPDKAPNPEEPRSAITDEKGRFSIRNVKAGTYKIEVSGKAHTLNAKDDVVVPEGRPANLELEAEPNERYLDLYANQRVFVPGESPELQIKGFVETAELKVTAYRLDFNQVSKEGSLYSALAPLSGQNSQKAKDPRSMGVLAAQETHRIENRDAEGTFVDTVKVKDLPEGIYWVQCESGKITRGTWFTVSRIAMVVKSVGRTANCYVTRIDTGEPVAGAEVGESVSGTYRKLAATDASGLATLTVAEESQEPVIVSAFGASRALVNFYKSEGNAGPATAYLYTDRPIYRPGDEVSFKGILRKLNGSDYRLPGNGSVVVGLSDEDGNKLEEQTLPLSAMGTYHGKFSISKEGSPGYYTISTEYGENSFDTGFSVATYRKPAYSISVTSTQKSYIKGQRAQVEVKAEYFFGGPVIGAEVTASIFKKPYFDSRLWGEDYEEWWSEEGGEGGYGGEYVDDMTAKTDANGIATFTIDTSDSKETGADGKPVEDEYDTTYTVSASVTDDSGKYFDGEGSFNVVRGAFSLAVDTRNYVIAPGETVTVDVRALANVPSLKTEGMTLSLQAGYEVWDRGGSNFTLNSTQQVTLDAEGKATATFKPETPGDFVIKAVGQDDRGNRVAGSTYVWIYGRGSWFEPDQKGIEAKLDKRTYKTGETARLMVSTSDPGGYAWVTVEGTKVYSSQVVPLREAATMVELPVRGELLPNAFVSVQYIRGKRYSEATKILRVDTSVKELSIKVTPDKPSYEPGQTATYKIETRTPSGTATQAECSLAVVDESIFTIARDQLDMVGAFYPRRYNAVSTNYSFPVLYLDGGDKAPSSIQVRRLFKDTAYWNPSIMTDANGQATVSVQLPDNLTSWRATVAAISGTTDVGQTTINVRARKPLMVRLEAPPALVVGDSIALRALVTNDSDADAEVLLQLDGTNASLQGDARRSQRLKQGETRSFEWMATATSSGTAEFVGKAWIDGGANDGVELKIPALPHGRTYVERLTGSIKSKGDFEIMVREGADRNTGGVLLSLTPSLGAVFVQSLDQLIGYPYGCVEQTMSRFLPTVAVSQAMKQAQLPAPKQAAEMPLMVADGYSRLGRMQHTDGGWGWWEYDESDPYMTAYVLEGVFRANQAGFEPKSINLESGLSWAVKYLDTPLPPAKYEWEAKRRTANRLYLAYALALHGKAEAAEKVLLSVDPFTISAGEAAYAVLGSQVLGERMASRRGPFLDRLRKTANTTAGTAKWEESYWGIETTARALLALVTVSPDDPLIGKAVNHLLLERRGDMWYSTRDSAIALIALSKVWAGTKEFSISGDLIVRLNGKDRSTIKLSPAIFSVPQSRIEIPMSELQPGENKIELVRTDGGPCHYSAQIRQVVQQESIGRIVNNDGLAIDRKYYKLRSTRLEDGTLRFLPDKEGSLKFGSGDLVRCELTIDTGADRQFAFIEDPIPAGFIVTERSEIGDGEEWDNWWAKTVIREDRIAFFIDNLTAGKHVLTYNMRAETPGTSHALPAIVSLMYDPGQRAGCPEDVLEVKPK